MLGIPYPVDRYTVQQTAGQCHEDGNLFGYGSRFEFRLFEDGPDSLPVVDDLTGMFIETGSEFGKGFQLCELRVGELEIARHRSVGRPLCLAADAGNRLADIDGGKNA